MRVPASMKLNLIPASTRPRSSEAEVGGQRGKSGGPPPPQKRGCSHGRATDPTSCRIQPLILPITNSTTLSLFARFGLWMIPTTSRLFQLRRRCSSLRHATKKRRPRASARVCGDRGHRRVSNDSRKQTSRPVRNHGNVTVSVR